MGKFVFRHTPDACIVTKRVCLNRVVRFALAMLIGLGCSAPVLAYTPESPEVKQAIAQAVKYLESNDKQGNALGAYALTGLAIIKSGGAHDNPTVVQCAQLVRNTVRRASNPRTLTVDIYSTGLAIIFLCELDAAEYRDDIEALLAYLAFRQQAQGAWGYPREEYGDTSRTQYGVLSLWTAKQAGFKISNDIIVRVATWLLKTQHADGSFQYKAATGPTNQKITPEETGVKPSMGLAGSGALLICDDMLGSSEFANEANREASADSDLPASVRRVKTKEEQQQAKRSQPRISSKLFRAAHARGHQYVVQNCGVQGGGQFRYYYLYTMERYYSFYEMASGQIEREPRWYNEGVDFLLKLQKNGGWGGQAETAFGVLFLTRSTKKSLNVVKDTDLGTGMLIGGRGLPKDTGSIEVRNGQVVPRALLGPAEKLIAALDDPESGINEEAIEALGQLSARERKKLISKNANRLGDMVRGKSPQARIVAIQTLAHSGNINHIPLLIQAISDPDHDVVLEARDGLRRLSRRFEGFGLPDRFDAKQRATVIGKWKNWYRAIRPDAP